MSARALLQGFQRSHLAMAGLSLLALLLLLALAADDLSALARAMREAPPSGGLAGAGAAALDILRGAETMAVNHDTGEHRADHMAAGIAHAHCREIPRALFGIAQCAGQILCGDVEKHETNADQWGGNEQCRQCQ